MNDRKTLSPTAGLAALAVIVTACGGTATTTEPAPTSTTQVATTMAPATTEATTTTTEPPATTTTEPATTTTATPTVDAATIHTVFADYMAAIVAKDWDLARSLSVGNAADYATFVEDLDAVSPQPDWQLESISEPDCCQAVTVDDGFASTTSITYVSESSTLAVANPVVVIEDETPRLLDWGRDIGTVESGPALSARLIALTDSQFDLREVCGIAPIWAYVPGGADSSETVRIITIGTACQVDRSLTGDPSLSRIYNADESMNEVATTMLWQGGPEPIPAGENRMWLVIYDVPVSAVTQTLSMEAAFPNEGGQITSFSQAEVGPIDLG